MKNTKQSITYKIIISYTLAIFLAGVTFWVIYNQVNTYTRITEFKNENNEKLFLVSQILTSIYEAESLTRNIIQTSDVKKFKLYKTKIDTIFNTINKIADISYDTIQIRKLDSITYLIDSKNENLEELIRLYTARKEKGIYQTAIAELQKTNESFATPNYEKRFKDLSPEFRKKIINILNISKQDNAQRLTNQTVDSLAKTVRKVLAAVDKQEQQFKKEISVKENTLLEKDQIITKQLRSILAAIEINERNQYYSRLKASDEVLSKTSMIILATSFISLLIVILFLFLIVKDIAKSQEYRNALEAEKVYKESLLKTRESLINTVTHDLRSPLNTVIGYSNLLEKTTLDSKQKHYLAYLKKSSDYILHLVNDLLDLSKLEAGKMNIEQLPFHPEKLIHDTVYSITHFNTKKEVVIHINTDPKLQDQYVSDPFRIKQILTNILSNAYKFTNQGSITIDGTITENGIAEQQLIISVTDTGIGITPKQQRYIFDEFVQGDDTTEKKYGGFGLGLAITQKIITLLRGSISLESILHKGSTFTIHIPIKKAKHIPSKIELPERNKDHFITKKVLIVDDDHNQLALTREVISLVGLSCDTSDNVEDALSLLQKQIYHLVLTDIQMPQKDGFEFLKAIREEFNIERLPVIALSGMTETNTETYLNAGFSGNLRKPYTPKALLELISKTLAIHTEIEVDSTIHIESNTSSLYSLKDILVFAHGDTASLHAILDTFYESTSENITLLKAAIACRDCDAIKKIAHKIVPMFKQLKATEVAPILNQLEHADEDLLKTDNFIELSQTAIIKIEALIMALKAEYSGG